MQFRNTRDGSLTTAEPDTTRFHILSRSERWEAVVAGTAASDDPLAALTAKELEALAAEAGIEVPRKVRKARLVEIVRDAGISVAAVEDEPQTDDEQTEG